MVSFPEYCIGCGFTPSSKCEKRTTLWMTEYQTTNKKNGKKKWENFTTYLCPACKEIARQQIFRVQMIKILLSLFTLIYIFFFIAEELPKNISKQPLFFIILLFHCLVIGQIVYDYYSANPHKQFYRVNRYSFQINFYFKNPEYTKLFLAYNGEYVKKTWNLSTWSKIIMKSKPIRFVNSWEQP